MNFFSGNYLYTTFSTKFEREVFFSSPKFSFTTKIKKLCLSFHYFMRKDGDKLRVYAMKNGEMIGNNSHVNHNFLVGKWNHKKIEFNSQIDQVRLSNIFEIKWKQPSSLFQLIFKAELQTYGRNDIAIDEIELTDCQGSSSFFSLFSTFTLLIKASFLQKTKLLHWGI